MRTNPIGYIINIASKRNSGVILCVIYSIDRKGKLKAADFAEIGTTFSSRAFNVSPGRVFTFQEELRVTARASDILPNNTIDIKEWIKIKMKEAYGDDIKIFIKQIKDKNAA